MRGHHRRPAAATAARTGGGQPGAGAGPDQVGLDYVDGSGLASGRGLRRECPRAWSLAWRW
jgi:hypothetical protein